MSSSQDVLHNSVSTGNPAPSLSQVTHGPVRLCKMCREAHYYELNRSGLYWETLDDDGEDKAGMPKWKLFADEWPNLSRLLESAEAGCEFCAFLRDVILSDKFIDTWESLTSGDITKAAHKPLELEFWYMEDQKNNALTVRVAIGHDFRVYLYFVVKVFADALNDSDRPVLGNWRLHNYEASTMTNFLKNQLQKLPDFHESDQINKYFLPERLIKVGHNSLHLVDRNNIIAGSVKRPQYCALSYCWGPRKDAENQIKTTTANLERHVQGMDFDDLSPVLKDAVKTARNLNIPYLWVDSICILQDDISDWQRQCSQMSDIYGNARVTLIATSSRTCGEGFLNPKRHSLRFPYQLVRPHHNNRSMIIYFTHVLSDMHHSVEASPMTNLHHELTFSRWARRGWAFQEEIMAGARIVFGTLDVYFGRIMDNTKCSYLTLEDSGTTFRKPVTSLQSKDELHWAWEKLMRRYSAFKSSSFTNSTNVLPALSSLARIYGNKLQVKYIAGHWMDRLHCTLLWVVNAHKLCPSLNESLNDIIKRYGQKPYLIPSFSYLTRGTIKSVLPYDTQGCRSEITILNVYMPTTGEDPYGAIQDACLTLQGFVLDLASLTWSRSPKRVVGSASSQAEEIWFQENAFMPHMSQYNEFAIFDPNDTLQTLDSCYRYHMQLDFRLKSEDRSLLGEINEPFQQFISRMTMLLVGCEERFTDNTLEHRHGYGLVLFRLDPATERSFLRVGTFYPHRARKQDSLTCLKRLMKEETIKLF